MRQFILLLLIALSVSAKKLDTHPEWMRSLSDDSLLSHLSIPGTHDSCALHGGEPAETQSMTLEKQLRAGIRFLDIRARHYKNSLKIYHKLVDEKLEFGHGVLDVVIKYLKEHPSETVVMSVKSEFSEKHNNRTYADTFKAYLKSTRDHWYLGDKIPRLGDVRGKIVLFRRFPIKKSQVLGIAASNWHDNRYFNIISKTTHLQVQDYRQVPTLLNGDMDLKWKRIEHLLTKARSNHDDIWYINFLNGESFLAFPFWIANGSIFADGMNKRLQKYLLVNRKGRIGTIMMDFPEEINHLISQIIQTNKLK